MRPIVLPSPSVAFGPDFLARLGRLVARVASARERQEGAGRARLFGLGSEFVGYRAYASGDDLRALDWALLARLGRPYVRVAAREASERWLVVLDTSASMGVGRPGKLQLGAEIATALAALAVARRARAELRLTGSAERCTVRTPAGLGAWMRVLAATRAQGTSGLAAAAGELASRCRGARTFLIGDLLDATPPELLGLARATRELALVQVLAPEELVPPRAGPVRWVDAESGFARDVRVGESAATRYETRLEEHLEGWRRAATRARAVHGCWTSDVPFERATAALCAAAG